MKFCESFSNSVGSSSAFDAEKANVKTFWICERNNKQTKATKDSTLQPKMNECFLHFLVVYFNGLEH